MADILGVKLDSDLINVKYVTSGPDRVAVVSLNPCPSCDHVSTVNVDEDPYHEFIFDENISVFHCDNCEAGFRMGREGGHVYFVQVIRKKEVA